MRQTIKYGLIAFLGLVMTSCAKDLTDGGTKLPKKKIEELTGALDTLSNQEYSSFYSKLSTKYTDTSRSISFKTSVRVVADSATNITVSYAKIPFVNSVITADSVFVSNRKDKCYTKQSLGFLKEKFSVDFSLKNIEEILMGLPLGYDSSKEYFSVDARDGYGVCTHNKRDLKKIEKNELFERITYFILSEDLSSVVSMIVVSPVDQTEIYIDYKEREVIDGYSLPKLADIKIVTPGQEITLEMEYKKTRINEVETIHFVIPESYVECE